MPCERFQRISLLLLIVLPACVSLDLDASDPRVGELGQVRFEGGGGCNSSTTLALGSTATLNLEPQEGVVLPPGLEVRSSDTGVIEGSRGASAGELVLTAHDEGEALVELLAGGELFDYLGFSAEPAASLEYTVTEAVLAGGTVLVEISEVYGSCGEDCPLIGGEFVSWSSDPTDGLTLIEEVDRRALFAVHSEAGGAIELTGHEPTRGRGLLDELIDVVDADQVVELEAVFLIALPDESIIGPEPLESPIPVGALFQVCLEAITNVDQVVPLTRLEAEWTVEGDESIISAYDDGSPPPPLGPVFTALGPGQITLIAEVPLLSRTARFDVVLEN